MSFGRKIVLAMLLAAQFVAAHGAERNIDHDAAAKLFARRNMMIDAHIDAPVRLESSWADLTQEVDSGDFDYDRAVRAGLSIPFMSIYTPPAGEEVGFSFSLANRMIDRVEALAGRAPKRIAVVRDSRQAEKAGTLGLMGLAMGMENGSPIDGKLENVAFFRERGISYITLAHLKSNHLADSSYDEDRRWNGLSPFGREVVAEMNRLGIMVDVSHLSDEAFWQILELSAVPVIASHSSARHFTPGFERNMSDEMIRALAGKGGVIMINFGSSFLTEEARRWFESMKAARAEFLEANGYEEHGDEAEGFQAKYRQEHPYPFATLDDLLAHFKHVIGLVGVEHVGFGSDFDGVGDSLPEGMKDVSGYPNLIAAFMRSGYSEDDIRAIMGGNLLRVWRAADEYAYEQDRLATAP
jgi:membrane dipeptidase